jgi:hypothetical protein
MVTSLLRQRLHNPADRTSFADGFLKASDICSGPAATACHQLGLAQ